MAWLLSKQAIAEGNGATAAQFVEPLCSVHRQRLGVYVLAVGQVLETDADSETTDTAATAPRRERAAPLLLDDIAGFSLAPTSRYGSPTKL